MDALIDQVLAALPLIAAAAVPMLIATVKDQLTEFVPARYFPVLLPVLGALVAGVAKAVGFDIGDFNPETADLSAWETIVAGALVGSASIGIHQIRAQLKE